MDFDPQALERWRARGVSVLYGDMADPEIYEQLPLAKARWVVSTVRSREVNLAMLRQLKNRGYAGKVALTAANQEEAALFEAHGAHVVFRPFTDAAEQAADALTHAMDVLPENVDWPIAFREMRIQSGSAFAGQTIRKIPLRSITGVSILAVSRAGRVNYELGPDFRIYPGDRLVMMGPPEELRQAEGLLKQFQENERVDAPDHFVVAEIELADDSPMVHQSLADIQFRQKHGVTVVGIRRGAKQITSPWTRRTAETQGSSDRHRRCPKIEALRKKRLSEKVGGKGANL